MISLPVGDNCFHDGNVILNTANYKWTFVFLKKKKKKNTDQEIVVTKAFFYVCVHCDKADQSSDHDVTRVMSYWALCPGTYNYIIFESDW